MLTRRRALAVVGAALAAGGAAPDAGAPPRPTTTTTTTKGAAPVHKRAIPRTGEQVPCVGLGTWQSFDVGAAAAERAPLAEVLRLFVERGGAIVDSSPMYGRAEAVVGDLAAAAGLGDRLFLATKVWTSGEAAGRAQIEASFKKLRVDRVDLLQVHNLLDVQRHLPTLRALKKEGRVRTIGVTHWQLSAFDALEKLLRSEALDFVQLPYSVATRAAEQRLLPAAKDVGAAVLVMRPFEEGALFDKVKGKPLPGWARDVGATSWAQLFLKFILSHDAVTAPIPATSKPKHLLDNMGAGTTPFLDADQRARLVAAVMG